MSAEQIFTTVVSVISVVGPAVLYITGQFKRLDAKMQDLQADLKVVRAEFGSQLEAGLRLVNQKIDSLERQMSDQQSHLLKIQDDQTSIAERVAITENNIEHLESRMASLMKKSGS
tara:strand:+ start:1774 stop:2121 length:348 start_codon:yes stop_codon:yes gene_type:complete